MRNLILGIIIGMLIAAPIAWSAAKDIRISDADGHVLDITSDGKLTISF